ncbi:MAG TPA: hypothetical protein EYG03_03865 [Planctomycetes bacterium]|nr:hypothetical protein [Fuerstiella sp.]HIK91115.1 hypothetical protein [Planctomycetota bacterium]
MQHGHPPTPYKWELDVETQAEVDRLLAMLETEVGRDRMLAQHASSPRAASDSAAEDVSHAFTVDPVGKSSHAL